MHWLTVIGCVSVALERDAALGMAHSTWAKRKKLLQFKLDRS